MACLLIIEDDADLARGLQDNLKIEGYAVDHAPDAESAWKSLQNRAPDLVLLDVMMPGIDGFALCRRIRGHGFRFPIIMLTARSLELDIVRGLELGADDYITKPFGLRELLARIKAALRRQDQTTDSLRHFTIGAASIDLARGVIVRGRETFTLGHCEIEILKLLVARPEVHVTRAELLTAIWGDSAISSDRAVDNHIVSLRRKIEPDPRHPLHLLTVHGIGYKFVP
jgi:DNA-binding response OmpR family regulator